MPDRPQLHAPVFGPDASGQWARLARVLRFTAARHCREWAVHIDAIRPPAMRSAMNNDSHVTNTQKMQHWHELVAAAPDGARLLLVDADTMILRPLLDLWDQPFDFAYTTKPSRFPFNSGVIAVRVSDAVRRFFATWLEENRRMLGDPVHHQVWRRKYGGINQAALGLLLERGDHRTLAVRELPCLEWNCDDSSWSAFDPNVTRIVHVKSALRAAIFFGHAVALPTLRLVKLWRALEQAALSSDPAAAPDPARHPARRLTRPVGRVEAAPGGSRSAVDQAPRGRPRIHEPGAITVHATLPPKVYDTYARRALAQGKPVRQVLRDALVAGGSGFFRQ